MRALENFWYCGIASIQLGSTPAAVQIGDRRIVSFRGADGLPRALADHCRHRGHPLSRGKVIENEIVCGFHGWRYNGAGQCVEIPSQQRQAKIAAACHTHAYPCTERDGYVWIWIGEGNPGPAPVLPEFSGRKWLQGARVVACNYIKALEINADIAHITFVHPGHPSTRAAARSGMVAQNYELRPLDGGFIVFSPPAVSADEPIASPAVQEFRLPGMIALRMFGFVVYFHIVPLDDATCRIEFLITNYAPGASHITWGGAGAAMLDEDAAVLEAIECSQKTDWAGPVSVEADAPAITLKKIFDAAYAGRAYAPPRRTFTVMSAPFTFVPQSAADAPVNKAASQ